MNAHCAYGPCGRIIHINDRGRRRRFCSRLCSGREGYRLRCESAGKAATPRSHPVLGRPCALTGCGLPVPAWRRANAIYCSPTCAAQVPIQRKYKVRQDWWAQRAITPAPNSKPKAVRVRPSQEPELEGPLEIPRPKLPPEARVCFGCRHMRLSPQAERGVLCAADLFSPCNPLAPSGPQLKEAI